MRRVYYLGVFVPLALALDLADASAPVVFFTSALGVVPAAALMSEATEQLAERSGPGVAGLLNVTFGNTPELIIAVFALADGLQEVVKASLVGSVIGNSLPAPRCSPVAGGGRGRRSAVRRPRPRRGCSSSRLLRWSCPPWSGSSMAAACRPSPAAARRSATISSSFRSGSRSS
jgi:calcium/proton exchanger cax